MSMTNTEKSLKNCLFGQTAKQPLSNLSPEYLENTRNFEVWGLSLECQMSNVKLYHIIIYISWITMTTCLYIYIYIDR